MNPQGSPMFVFDRADAVKVGKSLLIAVGGAAFPILSDYFAGTDFGLVTPLVTAISTVAINAGKRFVMDYSR